MTIGTLNNPGRELTIDLVGTALENAAFEAITVERSAEDWVQCRVEDGKFKGYGGVANLREMISMFLAFSDLNKRLVSGISPG